MKNIKKIIYFISACALLFLTNSCQEEEGTLFEFGGKSYASFDAAKYSFNAEPEGKIVVYLYQMSGGGENTTVTVSVDYNGAEDIFTVSPTQISFDADNSKIPVEISYDITKLDLFEPYTILLSIPEQDYPGTGVVEEQEVVITLQPEWELFGEGIYESEFWGDSWSQNIYRGLGVEALGIEVYMMPSLYVAGADFVFLIDVATGAIGIPGVEPNENGYYRWEMGWAHPDYGNVWIMFDPDPDWSWFDKDNKNAL